MSALTEDEEALLTHVRMHGSAGYPLTRLKSGWAWDYRTIKGPPVVFRTKREAVASVEAYLAILRDRRAGRL